jgi:hypothetical protein
MPGFTLRSHFEKPRQHCLKLCARWSPSRFSLCRPRSIGDFFTWGPVVTDAAYFREVRLRPGPVANVTVRQPVEALRELQRLDVPIIMGERRCSCADEYSCYLLVVQCGTCALNTFAEWSRLVHC